MHGWKSRIRVVFSVWKVTSCFCILFVICNTRPSSENVILCPLYSCIIENLLFFHMNEFCPCDKKKDQFTFLSFLFVVLPATRWRHEKISIPFLGSPDVNILGFINRHAIQEHRIAFVEVFRI